MAKSKNATSADATYEDKWRAQDDMRTLIDAEKIKKDPKRLKAAQKAAKEKIKEMNELADAAATLANGK